jgi:hypothetical protein
VASKTTPCQACEPLTLINLIQISKPRRRWAPHAGGSLFPSRSQKSATHSRCLAAGQRTHPLRWVYLAASQQTSTMGKGQSSKLCSTPRPPIKFLPSYHKRCLCSISLDMIRSDICEPSTQLGRVRSRVDVGYFLLRLTAERPE